MSDPIRIMLCDDSAVMRRLIKAVLQTDTNLQVVSETKHGQDALDQMFDARPDLVVMDVEMPVMDGIDAVREIRRRTKTLPVIMFSSLTSHGAEATFDAMEAGANDFATKPAGSGHINAAMDHVRNDLILKIYQWTGRPVPVKPVVQESRIAPSPKRIGADECVSAVAIGVSTGGPQALSDVISALPIDFPAPILIAQHMPPVFTGLLAERLAAKKGHLVREACDGDELRPGNILIAPGDYHMVVVREGTTVRARLNQGDPENSCRPAVDPLFRSMADCFSHKCLGIVLTGMGKDGEDGARALRQKGARVLAQDEQSSVVWGMPGNLVQCGLADRVLPLDQIAMEMIRATKSKDAASV